MELKIKDLTGATIEVTDLNAAIDECKRCKDSPYKMESGHTVGENYAYMLEQRKHSVNHVLFCNKDSIGH